MARRGGRAGQGIGGGYPHLGAIAAADAPSSYRYVPRILPPSPPISSSIDVHLWNPKSISWVDKLALM